MKKCKQGYYYCYTEKKCKKIPMGYHLGARGYLAKDNDNDNEGEDTTKNGNGDGNGSNGNGGGTVSEEGLRDWFGKSKSKDGKRGWVNVVTGGTCASDEPGEGTPKCVSSAKRASMTKAERLSAQRRKKKADPGQQQKSGAAKPTYVSTDSKKKMKKEEVEVTEAKDKKGKGSGSKDACYHKVKSRYSVWPSAYASGALVKCRKVGAANWGNKSESVEFSNWRDDFKATEYEFTDIIKPEPIKGGVIEEGSFSIDPKAHRQAQREKKIRDRTKTGDEGSSIAKTKTKGPDLMGEEQIEEGQKCWKGYEKKGTKKMFGKTYNNCVKKEDADLEQMQKDAAANRDRAAKAKKNTVTKGSAAFAAAKVADDVKKAARTGPQQHKGPRTGVKRIQKEGYGVGQVDQKVGAVTAIPKKEQDAAKARLLAKAKAKREKMKEENEIDEAKHTPTKSDLESKIGGGNLKKLSKKASTRIDYDVDGDVDPQDKVEKSKGDYGEELPTPFGKFKTKIKKEEFSDWKKEFNEGAAWTKKAGKNKEGGLNEKGRKSYEKENPGSDLKRPSKEVGNPRRKSFCARMKGMKKKLTSSKTANDPDSRINKSLRAWNC